MPEHFEVRRMADYLKDHGLIGQRLLSATFCNRGERLLKTHRSSWNALASQRLNTIKVKAKYTGFEFDSSTVLLHYRFTGIPHLEGHSYGDRLNTIFSLPILTKKSQHCRFFWQFETLRMNFFDTRALSHMNIYPGVPFNDIETIKSLPPDINDMANMSFSDWRQTIALNKTSLKDWLLNQKTCPSGIGNYLACEILAYSGLFPFIRVRELTDKQWQRLYHGIQSVIHYVSNTAAYDWFMVFNRSHCQKCNGVVSKLRHKASAQTTHFCPDCQI